MQFRALNTSTVAAAALAACLSTVGTSAHAALILTLSDGTNSVTVSDATDATPNDGFVLFVGSVGSWLLNVTTGLSDPMIGTPYSDEMHLGSVNVSGANAGSLTITLEDDGFEKLNANWVSAIGGVTAGTVAASTYIDGNLAASYIGSGGAFSNTQSGQVSALAPYGMKLVSVITHTAANQSTSFDYVVSVPEPGSLALMAGGLLGLVALRRRRRVA